EVSPPAREEAVRYYTAARALRPETAHQLAHLLDLMGRVEETQAVFADLVARRPDDARNLACYGRFLKDRGRREATPVRDQAVAAGRRALRARSDDALAHNSLGIALQAQGKKEEAAAEYRAASRLKPDFLPNLVHLSNAARERDPLEKTVDALRERIRV